MNEVRKKITVIRGDITKMTVDAIVNAANASLMGGGGVDGAIHRAGGPAILDECKAIIARRGSCSTGEAAITTGGNLPAKFVIHTVGPIWNGGRTQEDVLLANCYENCLRLAGEHEVNTIAFPNISTGIYGFPKPEAAEIAVRTVLGFLAGYNERLTVTFVCFDDENYRLYQSLIKD